MLFDIFQLKKTTRRSLRDKPSGLNEGGELALIADRSSHSNAIEDASSSKVDKVGDVTPIQDFEAMISRRDSPNWVDKAIADMKNKIHGLIEDSYNGDNYPEAAQCLIALRKACILEQVCLLSWCTLASAKVTLKC